MFTDLVVFLFRKLMQEIMNSNVVVVFLSVTLNKFIAYLFGFFSFSLNVSKYNLSEVMQLMLSVA